MHHSGTGEYYNNTFADNHSDSYGGVFGACNIGQQLEVRNSVFWGNTAQNGTIGSRYMCNGNGPLMHVIDSYFSTDPDHANFSWGTVTSGNNIDCCEDKYPDDPYEPEGFIEFNVGPPGFAGDGYYHITSDSPLIDRANGVYAPEDDIDGQARPNNGIDDMGADEYYAPADSTTAGYATAYATTNNTSITVTMPYLGDANGDNTCTVDYKLTSDHTSVWTNWVTDEDCVASPYSTPITGLTADEKYDVRMTYNDPDGVTGKAQRALSSVDLTPHVNLTTASQSVAEDVGTVTVTATLSWISGFDVTVPFTVSGTATSIDDDPINYDHDLSDGNIIITAGQLTGTKDFTLTDDLVGEANETVIVTMGAPENARAHIFYVTHTVTITDDDVPDVDFTSPTQSVAENVGTVTVTAQLSGVSNFDATVPFTINGSSTATSIDDDPINYDHDLSDGSITITAGQLTGSTTFSVTGDSLDESDETVIIDMGTPVNAIKGTTATTHTLTITDDDDPPTVYFISALQATADESGTATITAQLSAVSGRDVTVPFTINGASTADGSDYSISPPFPDPGEVTITAGNTTVDIIVTITDDSDIEDDETVIVDMGSPTNATQGATIQHILTITDDETPPVVNFSVDPQSVAEDVVGTVTITATLDVTSTLDVTVPFTVSGTATGGGTDHDLADGNIIITAGQLTGSTTFSVNDDSLDENDETVIVTMGTPVNATRGTTDEHTVTINDNDVTPTVQFTADSQATAGESGTATITAQLSAVSGRNVTVPY
ncbi:Calx-beta domain-containing protein, partial [Thermodesulfobacteriota bacterium]